VRTYVADGVVLGDVTTDISLDKIRPPEVVYQTGKASLTIMATGCVAKVSNPPVNFRRERVRDVWLTYNGFIHRAIHFQLAADKQKYGFGKEVPKTGVSFYMERAGGVRVTFNIMLNTYMSPETVGGTAVNSPDDDNFLFIAMYPQDIGEHDEPTYSNPGASGRAVYPNTTTNPGSTVEGDGPAGLRCITIHRCFDRTESGDTMITPGWYHVALFSGIGGNTKFALVGANTCVVEAHYGKAPTVSAGIAI
jgi:hypothetical protein